MHTTITLDRIFVCETCGTLMLFESDRDEHGRITGHSRFIIHALAVGKGMEYGDE